MNAPRQTPPGSLRRTSPDSESERQRQRKIEGQIVRAFAPLDRRALGLAIGLASALAMATFTALSLLFDPAQRFPIGLLVNFFAGYTVAWPGVIVGAIWAFGIGFLGGWFLAFSRNLVLTLWLVNVRIRDDAAGTRDILDQF